MASGERAGVADRDDVRRGIHWRAEIYFTAIQRAGLRWDRLRWTAA